MTLKFLILLTLITSFASNSQWYEAQGQAVVRNNDKQAARSQATQNALKKALLVAGASVSSIQQVVNGLLTQNELNIRASGNVKSVELIDEVYQDNLITVSIRADIFSKQKQCFSADYKKSLLLTRSHLVHRTQANIGGIYAIEKDFSRHLATKIGENSNFTTANLALGSKTHFSKYSQGLHQSELKALTMSLANMTDSQYVLYAEIEDVSFDNVLQNNWQFWQDDKFARNFVVTIYIYNGTNGEMIFEKKYQDSAPWAFAKRTPVDVNGEMFWRSDFGEMINSLLGHIVIDIDNNVMCQTTRGKLLNVAGNTILINLGARAGVKIGDEFSLLHVANFVTRSGETYAGFNVSNYKVKVIAVTQQTAKAITVDNKLLGNIQAGDLAVRY